ncbi:MFS transporter [Rhodopila sp.]|jgi:predicted MFS family arabinose efflux permease|uniref:MFS transporter n=1 Tax=Rhodopila sp. TaxID=2480087 RepID=UPI002CCFE2F4|nr:MFS transporter [Rhodopila sp.]HVZ09025.1 MFS transporter [Rhodopila sp.]
MAVSRTTRVNILIGNGHFLSHFYVLCLPPMFLAWQQAFEVSFAQLGMTIMLMSGTTALLQTPVGFLVDRHGARRFLIGGTLLMCLSVAAMGLATAFWQVLVLATLSGVGNSVIHPADYAILSGSVDKERMGRSFALHTFSGNLGFSAGPPVIAFLMALIGWRGALLSVGLVGLPVVMAILLQSRILVDQAKTESARTGMSLSGRALLTSRTMILFFLFFALGAMAGGGVQSWLVTVLHTVKGVDVAVAATALTAYMLGSTAGTLLGGWFADTFKAHILPFVTGLTILSALLILGVNWLPVPMIAIIGLTFVSGLALGASRTPRDMMVKDAAPPGQIGKVFGFVSAGLPLGSALTPVPFGMLIDRGHPELVLVLVAVILLLSLFCAGTARASGPMEEEAAIVPAE